MIRIKIERRPESTSKMEWAKVKEAIGDGLLILGGLWFLGHLVLFWIGGWIVIGEPSKPILMLETAGALGVIGLGIDRWRSHSKAK